MNIQRKMRANCFIWMFAFATGTGFWASVARAQVSVTIVVDTTSPGYAVPIDFTGLSFETGSELANHAGVAGNFFSPSNTQLTTLFQNLSVRNLRVGGGSVNSYTPANSDIDALFQWAPLAGVQVIYSVPLYNACASCDAQTAAYISQYQSSVQSLSIGNEQDFRSFLCHTGGTDPNLCDLPSYLVDWQNFASTILGSVPGETFSAPDTGAYDASTYYTGTSCGTDYPNGVSWSQGFADCTVTPGGIITAPITTVNQHYYVGHSPGTDTAAEAIEDMLSPNWVNDTAIGTGPYGSNAYTPYPWLYTNNLAPVVSDNLPYRLTESNDFLGGVSGASNAFASALWSLDYMHWWAANNAAGVNFHNKQWIYTDTIVPDPNPCNPTCGNYQTTPKGYGIKAFDLGGHGYIEPVTITNSSGTNLTAYAVGEAQDLYVTIINKTNSTTGDSTDANVTIEPQGFPAASAAWMSLTDGTPNDVTQLTATLGGASITNSSPWLGQWIPLSPDTNGNVTLTVPAATAAVVWIQAASYYAGPAQINQNGAIELFAASASTGAVQHVWQLAAHVPNSPSSNWSGWGNLGGVSSMGGVAVVKNDNKTLEIFVPTSGHVYHNWQLKPDGSWKGWVDMGSSSSGMTNLVANNNADGSLRVFGLSSTGSVCYASENAPEIGWSAWSCLTGQTIRAGFVVGQNLNGHLELFGADSTGNVWHIWQTNAGGWSSWTKLSGVQLKPLLAVARNLDGRLEVFGVDSSGNVWHNWQTSPAGSWNGWSEITGKQLQAGLVVGQNKDGRLVLFGVAKASPYDVWNIWQQGAPGSNFGGNWTDMGGAGMNARLVVSSTADKRIQLFGIGSNNDVWSNWQPTSGGGWNGWADFGGNGLAFYPGQP